MNKVCLITTGGTIAKTYDESDGSLRFQRPIVEQLISELRLPDLALTFHHLMSKDSLDLTPEDRRRIVEAVAQAAGGFDAVVVVHGTDTLATTGDWLCRDIQTLGVPIILTGAMRPYEFRDSDALQNMIESLLACHFLGPGVYVVMHNRVLQFPGVVKDRQNLTFIKPESSVV